MLLKQVINIKLKANSDKKKIASEKNDAKSHVSAIPLWIQLGFLNSRRLISYFLCLRVNQ